MKKFVALFMCILMLLLSYGCGSKSKTQGNSTKNNYSTDKNEESLKNDETKDASSSLSKAVSDESEKGNSNSSKAESSESGDNKNQFLVATEKDFKKLGVEFLDQYAWLYYSGEILHTCNFEKMDAKTFFDKVFSIGSGWSPIYEYYFGEIKSIEYSAKADPKGRFKVAQGEENDNNTGCYFKYSAEKVDWIIKNVFNITPNRKCKFTDTRNYYYDGYYYIAENGGYGGGLYSYRIKSHRQLSDGKYELDLEIKYYDNNKVADAGKIIAALKNIDGKRVWSFYSMNII